MLLGITTGEEYWKEQESNLQKQNKDIRNKQVREVVDIINGFAAYFILEKAICEKDKWLSIQTFEKTVEDDICCVNLRKQGVRKRIQRLKTKIPLILRNGQKLSLNELNKKRNAEPSAKFNCLENRNQVLKKLEVSQLF